MIILSICYYIRSLSFIYAMKCFFCKSHFPSIYMYSIFYMYIHTKLKMKYFIKKDRFYHVDHLGNKNEENCTI